MDRVCAVQRGKPSSCGQASSLLWKRLTIFRRSPFERVISWVLALLMLWLAFWLHTRAESLFTTLFTQKVQLITISLKELLPESRTFLEHDAAAQDYVNETYLPLLYSEGSQVEIFNNTTARLLADGKDFIKYASWFALGTAAMNGR